MFTPHSASAGSLKVQLSETAALLKASETKASEALIKVTEKTDSESSVGDKRATDWIKREKDLLEQVQYSTVQYSTVHYVALRCRLVTAIQLTYSLPLNFLAPITFSPKSRESHTVISYYIMSHCII